MFFATRFDASRRERKRCVSDCFASEAIAHAVHQAQRHAALLVATLDNIQSTTLKSCDVVSRLALVHERLLRDKP